MTGDRYFTKSAVLVEEVGRKHEDGKLRVLCLRVVDGRLGGRMGWLVHDRLTPTHTTKVQREAAGANRETGDVACCYSRVGNRQCPCHAMYEIEWTPHRVSGHRRVKRRVCMGHLVAAIDDAHKDSHRDAAVEVRAI